MISTRQFFAGVAFSAIVSFGVGSASATTNDSAAQDKSFVADSGKGSLAEIQMAKLALANSSNPDVKDFAAKMVHDHQMLIDNMKPFARQMGVRPPAKMERAEQMSTTAWPKSAACPSTRTTSRP